MKTLIKKYNITLEGNDLDVKALKKLKKGDSLQLKRVNDAEDTFEICVCTPDGKETDMLTYAESIGIAPFIDDGSLAVKTALVDSVVTKAGKSRAKDRTTLYLDVEYEYDEELLAEYTAESGTLAFMPQGDLFMQLAIAAVVNGDSDILFSRPYLNLYAMDIPLEDKEQKEMFDCGLKEDADYSFLCQVLFDETFTKCKVMAKIYNTDNEDEEFVLELEEDEKLAALTFVNHARIFDGEDGINCEIE